LAITCALEHFTALLASRVLTNRSLYKEGTDPAFASLWLWHAAEEIEHKGVCYDVYEHVFGRGVWPWLHRCFAMGLVTFCGAMGLLVAFSLVRVRLFFRARPAGVEPAVAKKAVGPSLGNLFGALPLSAYTAYFGRNFHPWDHDDRPLLEAWKSDHPNFGLPDHQVHQAA
jgi:uncharacterized protein